MNSVAGEGTTLTVVVPVGPLTGVERIAFNPDTLAIDPPSYAAPTLPRLRARVLVVDDQFELRSLVQTLLKDSGATVTTAENGAAALAAVSDGGYPAFDVIVMDIQMPGMNGLRRPGDCGRKASGDQSSPSPPAP